MISYILQLLMALLPDTRFYKIKVAFLRCRGFNVDDNVMVVSTAKFKLRHLSIGKNSFIGHEVFISGGADSVVALGCNVDIAPRCVIIAGTHDFGIAEHRAGVGKSLNITIGDGSWIGANSTIIGGVTIGKGSIIGAGSVVVESIPDNVLAVGVPAKVIRILS